MDDDSGGREHDHKLGEWAPRRADASVPEALACSGAEHAMRYPYKIWGFGEDIALRALLDLSDVTGDPRPADFVHDLVGRWCAERGPLVPADHVAPGVVLLKLHARHGESLFLEAALELGRLLTTFPVEDGVAVHRRDLKGLSDTIWVDCMALDGPFLARLAVVTGEDEWADHALEALLGYARVLQDDSTGLFFHGYDVNMHGTNRVHWGRGNGWALHGLVDTIEELPRNHVAVAKARRRLERLLGALAPLQDASGLWHTILDDKSSPLESSTAAFFASGAIKARRLGLGPAGNRDAAAVDRMTERALAALRDRVRADGALEISSSTPVGDRATYAGRSVGVYPWGQGPLVLTFTEWRRSSEGRPRG